MWLKPYVSPYTWPSVFKECFHLHMSTQIFTAFSDICKPWTDSLHYQYWGRKIGNALLLLQSSQWWVLIRHKHHTLSDKQTTTMPKRKGNVTKFKKAPDAPKRFKSAFMFFSEKKHKAIREQAADDSKVRSFVVMFVGWTECLLWSFLHPSLSLALHCNFNWIYTSQITHVIKIIDADNWHC